MIKKRITIAFFTFLGFSSMGQGIHFSQWYDVPLLLNPANSGSIFEDFRANLNFRNQWATVGNSYTTILASFDMPAYRNKENLKSTGAGITFFSDKAGKSNYGRTEATLSISQSITTSEKSDLALGLGINYGQVSANFDNLKWDNQYNGTKYNASLPNGETNIPTSSSYLDANLGFLIRIFGETQNETNFGVSVLNITENWKATLTKNSLSDKRRRRFIGHFKSEILVNSSQGNYFVPTLFVSSQGGSSEIGIGGTYKLNLGLQSRHTNYYTSSYLEFGGIYRHNDAIVTIIKYSFEKKLQLGISYDINISKLRTASAYQGGLEVSLVWKGRFNY